MPTVKLARLVSGVANLLDNCAKLRGKSAKTGSEFSEKTLLSSPKNSSENKNGSLCKNMYTSYRLAGTGLDVPERRDLPWDVL